MKKEKLIGLIAAVPMAIPVEITKVIHKKIKDKATKDSIEQNHLFHFTSVEAADKILESGYIKPSGIVNSHYTNPKVYMYLGMPDIDTFRKNAQPQINPFLNNLYEFNAVEIIPTKEDVEKLKIRKYNDNVIVKNGKYIISKGTESIVEDDENVINKSRATKTRIVIAKGKEGNLEFQKFDENVHQVDENGKYIPNQEVKNLLKNYVDKNSKGKEYTNQVIIETNNLLSKFKNYLSSKFNKNKTKMLNEPVKNYQQNNINVTLGDELKDLLQPQETIMQNDITKEENDSKEKSTQVLDNSEKRLI